MRKRKFNLSPVHGLILEIMRQCGGEVDEQNLIELAQDFVGHFGSPERAIAALRSGDAGVDWVSDTLN